MGVGAVLGGVGSAVGGIGQLLGAHSQQQAANQARQDQLNHQALINSSAQGMMQNGPNVFQSMLSNGSSAFNPSNFKQLGQTNLGAMFGQTSNTGSSGYNSAGIDTSSLPMLNTNALNTGSDGLMQALRGDPSSQTNAARIQMTNMMATGDPYNTKDLLNNANSVNQYNTNQAVSKLQGANAGLGARFGSAGQLATGGLISQMTNQQNLQNSQVDMGAYEAAQGRKMNAAQSLINTGQQDASNYLQGRAQDIGVGSTNLQAMLSSLGQNASASNQAGQFNAGAMNQASLANMAAQNNMSQFNAQQGNAMGQFNTSNALNTFNANNAAQNQQMSQFLNYNQLGNQMDLSQRQQNSNLLGIMAGQTPPGASQASGAMGNAISGLGESAGNLGTLLWLMGQGGQGGSVGGGMSGQLPAFNPMMSNIGRNG